MNIRFFVDFDGTICLDDLGDKIFIELGKFEPHHSQLVNKEISIKEYWKRLCNTLDGESSLNDIKSIASNSEIDYYFKDFHKWVLENNFEIYIVSDGFSIYIDEVLKKYKLETITRYCNEMRVFEGKICPYFPEAQETCNCLSASCKRNIVLNNSNDDDIIVYIGDGYSDFCPAEHSDIVFAKKNLASYCNEEKIPHYPFKNFFEIKSIMMDTLKKRKIKKRNIASINRKNAFERE